MTIKIKRKTKVIQVKEHARKVPVSQKNPKGITIVDQHKLTQVTQETLKILQDLDGEAKDFVFKDIRQIDLNDPNVSVALGVRWLAQKQKLALSKLKRAPTPDEVVMIYKGILEDKSKNAISIMKKYRGFYEKLKK